MQQKRDSTWQRNAGSQIVLDSIFAALAGIWITFALPDQVSSKIRLFEVMCSLFSFFCFAVSAEGTTTSFDEADVLKYVYYLFWYNVGVVLLGAAIAGLILTHFELSLVNFLAPRFSCLSPHVIAIIVNLYYFGVFFMLLWLWIRDAGWILCTDTAKFNEYLKELNDESAPEIHRRRFMSFIFKRRIRNEPAAT
jgi:hypothetical protein